MVPSKNFFHFCIELDEFFYFDFQIKKLLNKPVIRESCYYRKLTDSGKDESVSSLNEALIENLTGELAS